MMQTLVKCPNCGSSNIKHGEGEKKCECLNCGHKFRCPTGWDKRVKE